MRTTSRVLALPLLAALVLFAGWRVVGQMAVEHHRETEPRQALQWRPVDPQALQHVARQQLQQGQVPQAVATLRTLLAHEPLQGQAFTELAGVADSQAAADAAALYAIAARRAPRDVVAPAWLAQRAMQQKDYPAALAQIDRVLRLAPQRAPEVAKVLVQMAQDPAFAEALAELLRSQPPWRPQVLSSLRGAPQAEARLMGALHARGGLSPQEYADWLESLMAQGRWGAAYARWAGGVVAEGQRLPKVFNGAFSQIPSGVGFDWRRRRVPGVLLSFEPATGTQGQAARLRFLDRRVASAGLEQPLLLPAGTYRLQLRQRAEHLQSGLGLQWQILCVGPAGVVGRSEAIDGSFDWRDLSVTFTVPPDRCPGQWLRLVNPVASGAAQRVSGELWVDDVQILPQS